MQVHLLAIGNNLAGFVAQDRLHLHHDFNPINNNVRMRFTHSGTAATSADGSTIGINNLGEYHLIQNEVQPMIFQSTDATSTREVLRLTEDDRIIAFRFGPYFTGTPPSNYPSYSSKFEINDRNSDNIMLFREFGGGQKVNGFSVIC